MNGDRQKHTQTTHIAKELNAEQNNNRKFMRWSKCADHSSASAYWLTDSSVSLFHSTINYTKRRNVFYLYPILKFIDCTHSLILKNVNALAKQFKCIKTDYNFYVRALQLNSRTHRGIGIGDCVMC